MKDPFIAMHAIHMMGILKAHEAESKLMKHEVIMEKLKGNHKSSKYWSLKEVAVVPNHE